MSVANAPCPVRPGDPCTQCAPGASGPEDCGVVWLMAVDPDLDVELHELRQAQLETRRVRVHTRG